MENLLRQFKISFIKISENDKSPMICITDDKNFDYSNISNMYEGNKAGHGIQVSLKLSGKEDILMEMCDKISQAVYEASERIRR